MSKTVRLRLCTCALMVLAATACGSTVAGSRYPAIQAPNAADGLSGPGASGQTPAGQITGPAAGGSSTQPPAGAFGTGQRVNPSANPSQGSSRPPGATAINAATAPASAKPGGLKPVEIGVEYFDSSQAVAVGKALGYTVSPGDPYGEAKALVTWVNQHGGFAGHRVDPIFWQLSPTGDEDTQEQSACQTWTQDHHVAAVIWPNNFSPSGLLPQCLARSGVMVTGGADSYLNSPQLRADGGYLQTPYMFAGDRMYQLLIDRLVAMHWFSPSGKIGVLSDDGNTFAVNVQMVDQALARHGLKATDHATLSTSAPQQDPTDCQSAGLRFAADHVTNIVVIDDGARAFLYCSPVFRSQNYFPKFSMTSYDSPSTVQTLVPASSLRGSAGIGWEPVNDVQPFTLNQAGRQCVSIMRSAGENVTASAFTEAIAFAYCDAFFFLRQAYATATTLAPNAVRQVIAGMGTSYQSPATFVTRFAPERYDGVGATADLAYQDSCGCYRYQSGPRPTG